MARTGLKYLCMAIIIEDNDGNETYGTPELIAPVMKADINIRFREGSIDADDKPWHETKEFADGTISIGIADLLSTMAAKLLGSQLDNNDLLVDSVEDDKRAPFVAVGFASELAKGGYELSWYYRVQFSKSNETYQTKSKDGIVFNTPSLEGKIYQRNKALSNGDHPWRVRKISTSANISAWFASVPEPTFTP